MKTYMQATRLFSLFVLLLISLSVKAQTKAYEVQWKKVDELYFKKRLPKSALAEVKKIYAQAKKEGQDAQVIKALVYTVQLQQVTREESSQAGIREIETELKGVKEPSASILKSLLANQYWNYLQQNRWKFYDRTKTVNYKRDDIATWSLEDLHKRISELYLSSIQNERLLKATTLSPYDAIIVKGNVRHLRPTLYDLLAHEALDYFRNDERDLAKPAYAFEISGREAFAPAVAFMAQKFETRDSLSLHHKALLIYQKLMLHHITDARPDPMIDLDIDRIAFVYQYSTHEDKDSLYRNALEHIRSAHPNNQTAHKASYLLALHYEELANSYNPLQDTTYRFARLKAKELLEPIVKDSSGKTEIWAQSYNLLAEIKRKALSFQLEKVNIPDQPFRALVSYRDVPTAYFRLIKADERTKKTLEDRYEGDKYWNALINAPSTRSWSQALPATGDLQMHSTEVKIDALPVGEYILLASSTEKPDLKQSILGVQLFYVSNISFVNHEKDHFVLHRTTGQPLQNALVNVWQNKYDYKTEKNTKEKHNSFKTDGNGFFRLERKNDKEYSYNYMLEIIHNNEKLFMDDQYYAYFTRSSQPIKDTLSDAEYEKQTTYTYFFTDRSIYRPGQTLFFKGISIANSRKTSKVIRTNFKTTVYLRNANHQVVDSMQVTTNEFGSFSGKFNLSQNTLNGVFSLQTKDNRGYTSISVEEYKRPKFYVEFEKLKETYKVYDTITLTGNAKAYAGNTIDGAKVKYRVVRQPRYIYPWRERWWWPQPTQPMEIINGEATTDNEGKFTISFAALPDKSIDKKMEPLFDYTVYADVTDINGETRSNSNRITAGYKSLVLKVSVDERVELKQQLNNLSITTENLNGEFQPANMQVTISKLLPEERLIRRRLWQQPSQAVMSKEEFIKYFPNDEYKNELDKTTWQKQTLFTQTDTAKRSGVFAVNNQTLSAGHYQIEIVARDKAGQEVKDIRYVELYDPATNKLNTPDYFWVNTSDKAIEPGEKDTVAVGSSAQQVFLIHQRTDLATQDKPNFSFYNLSNEKKDFVFNATEKDRGGFGLNFFFVKNNRFYHTSDIVQVPWSNKDLQIEYATFRDKTLPGSEEKWKVKISGYKGEKAAAEMLASMYDASLDQFKPHSWNKPNLWPVFSNNAYWSGDRNFSIVTAEQRFVDTDRYASGNTAYDELITNIYSGRYLIEETEAKGIKIRGQASTQVTARMSAPVTTESEWGDANSQPKLMILNKPVIRDGNWKDVGLFGDGVNDQFDAEQSIQNQPFQPRKNFNETAFFFPDLKTNAAGDIEFSFTTPEALTRWKLQTLAHTKEVAFGLNSKEIITQKELMVQPNAPRFLRQGDRMEFPVKIVNLSDKEFTGQAQLELIDATTNQSVDGWFMNTFPNQYFTVAAGQSEVVKFPIQVPYQFTSALTWRVVARTSSPIGGGREGALSDGEEMALPVLSNKTLVTETLPLPMRGEGSKTFTFKKLTEANSETLQHQALTVEYTSNPAWYAVQALPYLMEYPYECAEQNWNRYYANALASMIVNKAPRIKAVFSKWLDSSKASPTGGGLEGALQKNQELKTALLEETPWVMQAKSEEQQKKNIALLFDAVRMSNELKANLQKLKAMQLPNGAFPWFKGGSEDRYITQYILTGIGHLIKLNALSENDAAELNSIIKTALTYLDKKIKQDYDNLKKYRADLSKQQVGYNEIQYLYMRSFFPNHAVWGDAQIAYVYYQKQAAQFWTKQNKYAQGMTALALHRKGDKQTPTAILKSLKETSINHEELGMYWKDNEFGRSWFWWAAPIETQSLMIEVFAEVAKDTKTVDDLKTWLLKNKQTNNWRTTKATADACYALLLQGTNWLANEPTVQIRMGNSTVSNKDQTTEAGTGYFKKTVPGEFVQPDMGRITVSVQHPLNNSTPQQLNSSWGAVYWQYFEEMDKISTASTPLQLNKKLFIEKNSDRGPVLTPVDESTPVKVGDKIKVRIELKVDRDMEYVHMKDLRSSGLEPVNVLSGYKWQGGLGYYETTKDASTNFFFNYLKKGTYIFEYPLFVTHTGNFSNGITTIQCMYAPEFSAHSEGVRLNVE
jgi:uncharacterized protein YfaS (alpha-2-macroglobulin family)